MSALKLAGKIIGWHDVYWDVRDVSMKKMLAKLIMLTTKYI